MLQSRAGELRSMVRAGAHLTAARVCWLPACFEVFLMPRSIHRNDIHWSLSPKDCCVLEESLNAPLGQFYSSYTCRMMQKATESQARIKSLDFSYAI